MLLVASIFFFIAAVWAADDFQPCPLLGPRFPIPSSVAESATVQKALRELESKLDSGVATSNTSNGPIFPNTTSFGIVIFDASDGATDQQPFFFEYHHTASVLKDNAPGGVRDVDADSIFRVGGLTEMFAVWTLLAEVGDGHWGDPVTKWVPELASAAEKMDALQDPVSYVDWDDITLGDLASHTAGIGRDCISHPLSAFSNDTATCGTSRPCSRQEFFKAFTTQPPVFLPGTTPVKSIAGYQILAYALEAISSKPFNTLLNDKILHPLQMSHTTLTTPPSSHLDVTTTNATKSLWTLDLGDQSPASGLYTTTHDLSLAGRALLSSTLLPASTTRRWLKPQSHTSNLVNAVGRPWETYSAVSTPIAPVIDVFTARGNFGAYSSYFGLVPDYNVGYAVLAADEVANADLNPYVDLVSDILPALEAAAAEQAEGYIGVYVGGGAQVNITSAGARVPGLNVETLQNDDVDVKASYADALGIAAENLSMRLYPANLQTRMGGDGGTKVAFRAVFQDMAALEDAGTPTCETWRTVDEGYIGMKPIGLFVFEWEGGRVSGVEVVALGVSMGKM